MHYLEIQIEVVSGGEAEAVRTRVEKPITMRVPCTRRIWRKRVGVENNADWNFKDLEEMMGNAKTLKRNTEGSRGILIGPSLAPRFFRVSEISSSWVSHLLP